MKRQNRNGKRVAKRLSGARRFRRLGMEQLETRNLLCEGVPPLFDPPPDSYRSDNVSDDLARVAYEFDRWASGPNGVQRDFSPTFCEAVVRDGRVLVEAIAADAASGPALVSELRAIDVEIIASYEHGVSAWVPLTRIDDLSGLSELLYANIAFAHGMVHEPVGQVLHPVAQIVDGAAQIAPVGAVDFRGTRNVPAVRVDDYSDVPVFYRSSRVSDQLARTAFEFAQRPPGLDIHDYVPTDDWVSVREGLVLINAVSTSVPGQKLGEALATLGANVLGSYAHGVAAWLPVGRIPELGKLADLTFASPSLAFGMTHAGNAMTQGDAVIRTDQLRTTFGFDGTGQTIGVISDSYNRLTGAANDIANGDLPNTGATLANPTPAITDNFGRSVATSGNNVVVGAHLDDTGATNSGQAYVFNVIVVAELPTNSVYFPNGTDEGRAMLQIAYDVAPNANLAFATAHGGKFGLAAAINALRDAGATVIVDDVLYPDEPMFMDGVVAQAADAAVAAGVSYVSAVGNSARRSYETTAFANSAVLGNYGRGNVPLHDFDPGPAVDVYQQITIPANAAFSVVLQWQDPFMTDAPASGGATHDLDLLLLNAAGNTILQSSTLNNPSTTRDPFEILTYVNGPTQLTANLVVAGVNVAGLGRFKYVVTNSNVTIDQFPTNSGTSYGHSNAAGVIAVGAEDALTAPLQLEPFSSAGGVPILFNSVGQPIAAQTRQTPDIVGPDNVNTTFFGIDSPNDTDTLPNFAGTSAAAPHVAGLLALLRQANPTATPAELLTALTSTATDMGIAGYDNDTGFGAVNGLEAEYNLFKPALAPDLSAASDNGQSSTDNVTSLTTLTFTGTVPAASFVGLFDNGGSVPVASQQLAAAATAYSINVTVPSNTAHSYSIRVKSSSTSTNYSKFSPALPVYVDALATYTPPVPDLTAASDTGYSNTDNITTNTTPTFAGTLAANGTSALVTLWVDGVQRGSQQLAAGATSYTITSSTLSAGSHSALIRAKKVTSAPTTSYFSSPSLPFTIDTSPPVGTITPVSPPGNAPPQSSFTITFNKGVVGVDLSDFTLTRNGGANRLPGSATLTASADSKTFTISHFADITMAAGSYVLTLNYANSGIQSFAGVAPTGTNPSTSWSQGSGTTGFQNAARYYDVDNDTYVSPLDSLIIINATDTGYSGPLPGGAFTTAPPFLDANGDSNLSPIDALVVINFIDAYSGGGGGPYLLAAINSPPPEVSLQDVTASVELEIVDSTGAVVTSVQVGDQFELRARLIVNGPPGVAPFAAYTDVRFTPGLIVPAGVVGNASSLQGQAEIDDAGGIMYDFRSGESSSVIFGQSFIATKSGTVTFSADAADLFGHDILVTGLNQPLPLSQVAFGTTRLKITAKRK